MRSLIGGLRRALSDKSANPSAKDGDAFKRTTFEHLEKRCLLASNVLASIGGTVYNDHNDNGVTADDVGVKGVGLTLYRDGGNSVFDAGPGGDTLVGSATTDDNGAYQFTGLGFGTYFVQQEAINGFVAPGPGAVKRVDITVADLAGVTTTPIDGFVTPQEVEASNITTRTASSSVAAAEALGGERDLWTELTSNYGIVGIRVYQYQSASLHFDTSIVGDGRRILTWDGADGNGEVLNPVGLGGVDLTEGGAALGLRFGTGADLDGGTLTFRVYSDKDNWSQATVTVPGTGSTSLSPMELKFSDFVASGGSGADFENVGAVQLEIIGVSALDGSISPIERFGPAQKAADFINVEPIDLSIVKSDNPDPVVIGEELTYTLVVKNNTLRTATGVTVTDNLPAKVTYKSADAGAALVTHSSGVVTVDLGTMTAGDTATITIVVTVNQDAPDQLFNTATVIANETEITLVNNTDDEPTLVVRPDSSISGFVYVDADDDGIFDPGEIPLSDVNVALSGVDFRGNTVTRSQLTASNGAYSFTNLLPGSYTVDEAQPAQYADGKDTLGRTLNGLQLLTFGIADDVFTSIGLAGGVDAIEFNFGELNHELSKRNFLASS